MTKRYLNWIEFDEMVENLAEQIKDSGRYYNKFLTFQRGGGPLATMLGHLLEVTDVITENPLIKIFIKGEKGFNDFKECIAKSYLNSREIINYFKIDKETLVIDDLAHSGRTIEPYAVLGLDTAVIFHKIGSVVEPTYYVESISEELWINFPYEQLDAPMKRDRDLSKP